MRNCLLGAVLALAVTLGFAATANATTINLGLDPNTNSGESNIAAGNLKTDYAFSLSGPTDFSADVEQAFLSADVAHTKIVNLMIALFSGTPGSGVFISSDLATLDNSHHQSASVEDLTAAAGNYYFEITGIIPAHATSIHLSYAVDTLSVADAVPEPSTWAMMLIGLAGLGFMAFRRQTITPFA